MRANPKWNKLYADYIKSCVISQGLYGFKTWFTIGAIVLFIGLAFTWYPNAIIGGWEQQLSQPNLMPLQQTTLQNDVGNWTPYQITIFQPISIAFFTGGVLMLVYAVISAVLSIFSGYVTTKKEQKE